MTFHKEPSRSGKGRVVPENKSSSAPRSGQGTTEGQRMFSSGRGDSNLGGVAIFGDTIDDRGHLRSYGVRCTPGADKVLVGTVSFVVWAAD